MTLTLLTHAAPWKTGAPRWALHDGTRLIASGPAVEPGEEELRAVMKGADIGDVLRERADGLTLAPGLVDSHCHGGGGRAFEDALAVEDAVPAILRTHGEHGTAVMTASLVSGALPRMAETIRRVLAQEPPSGVQLAGIHLEGPCLSPLHKGAHAEEHLRAPTVERLKPLLEAAEGRIRQVTLAPELDEGFAVTRFLAENGVRVAIGHTNADYETARAAFDAGATLLTHTFNAMRGLHHRDPGPIAAALETDTVWLELIADGVHVHPPLIRMLFREAAERVVLVTDAMAAAACGDGRYRLGELDVDVAGGTARLADGGAIAGSTLTMDRAVRFAVGCGVPLEQAVTAATISPAKALGLDRSLSAGGFLPGAPRPSLLRL